MVAYGRLTTLDVQQVNFNFTREWNALTGSSAYFLEFQTSALLASSSPLQRVRTGPCVPLTVAPSVASGRMCQRPRGPLAGRILETSRGPCKKPGCIQSCGQKSGVDAKPLLFLIWQSRAGSGWGKDLDTFSRPATDLVFCKWLKKKKSFHKDWSYVTSPLLVLCLLNGIKFSLFIEHILKTPKCCKFWTLSKMNMRL